MTYEEDRIRNTKPPIIFGKFHYIENKFGLFNVIYMASRGPTACIIASNLPENEAIITTDELNNELFDLGKALRGEFDDESGGNAHAHSVQSP